MVLRNGIWHNGTVHRVYTLLCIDHEVLRRVFQAEYAHMAIDRAIEKHG
jgi:hypothetical protein